MNQDNVNTATVPALRISTGLADMDVPLIHHFLSQQSAWAQGVPLATLKKAMAHSLCFGGFLGAAAGGLCPRRHRPRHVCQPGGRVRAARAPGSGVQQGLDGGRDGPPRLQGLRRFTLATRDAHGLYAPFGSPHR